MDHIDIRQRDEPAETALLMRCCSISSFAHALFRSLRSGAVEAGAMASNSLSQRHACAPRHPAQPSRFRYQKSMFPVRRKTLNTLLTTQQPDRGARRRRSGLFDRLTPSSP
ncbi:hypothetical protein [Burkholderia latens]|uniref:hypothetical protein n=1 Tax=Burkholderia latens TaxID=488446 RepID=UPI00158C6365|nr:hypothetical protein [Burkholderia latens]